MMKNRIAIMVYVFLGVSLFGTSSSSESSTHVPANQRTDLHKVFVTPYLRSQCMSFMTHVLQHADPGAFFSKINKVVYSQALSDAAWYEQLQRLQGVKEAVLSPYNNIRALRNQKRVVGGQIEALLKRELPYEGCVEIGTPGTYAALLKKSLPIQGSIYVVNDEQRLTDIVQAGDFKPASGFKIHDVFVPLNNYAPIEENIIPSSSVDLIIFPIGLHHAPVERLDDFLISLRRILRPGGVLLLRDHDADTADTLSLVHAAHSIFNVYIARASLAEEVAEYRNFHALAHWIQLLTKHGFVVGSERIVQSGDTTKNTLFVCTKPAFTSEERVDQIAHEVAQKPGHTRDSMQGMLTVPEWHDVHRSQAYGKFINHTPFYEFPYFDCIKSYWRVFAQSFVLAKKQKGTWAVLKSDYTQMNLFIGCMTTLEYAAKGVISLPIKWLFSGQEAGVIQLLVKDPQHIITTIDSRIKVLQEYPENVVLIESPRYIEFLGIMRALAATDIDFVQIAGQKEIQCTIRYKNKEDVQRCVNSAGCTYAYDWQVPAEPYTYAAVLVKVSSLKQFMRQLPLEGVELVYVHDF